MATEFQWPFPTTPPDEGSFHTCQFNAEWLPVVASVLQQLNDPKIWESPPDDFLVVVLRANFQRCVVKYAHQNGGGSFSVVPVYPNFGS